MSNKPLSIPPTFKDSSITVLDEMTLQCKGVRLLLTKGLTLQASNDKEVALFKDPRFVQDYINQLDGFNVRNMIEVGVWHGGSAIFFWNLLKLEKLCCIDKGKDVMKMLQSYIDHQKLSDKISVHAGVDQADKDRLNAIANDDFGEQLVDVVIDDASHLYHPSRATFETLFPRLREGGLYFLEDWKVGFDGTKIPNVAKPKPPLLHLVHQLINLSVTAPGIVPTLRIFPNFVVIERGPEALTDNTFELSKYLPLVQ